MFLNSWSLGRGNAMALNRLLDRNLFSESLQWIAPLNLLELHRRMLVQELVNAHVATAHTDLNLVFLDTNVDFLGTELVYTLCLAHEHQLQLVAIWVVVDELCHLLVDLIALDWHIDSDSCLQVDDVVLESLSLNLKVTHLPQ